jgi:amino acid transporter
VFGTLTVAQVDRHGVTAIAEAARPALGDAGFIAVAAAALVATAAAANATLKASPSLTEPLAEAGLFPSFFATERTAFLATGGATLVAANLFSPSAIAAVGSALALIVFLLVGLAAWRRRRETLSNPGVVALAIVAASAVLGLFARETWQNGPATFTGIVLVVVLAFVLDYWTSVQHPRDDVPRGFLAAPES